MTARYLLPCACGQKVIVEPPQAGGRVRCTCGRSWEVPTMLEMAKLQRAEPRPETQRPTSRWGWHQSAVLLGIAIVLGTIVAGVHIARSRPDRPAEFDVEVIRKVSRDLMPVEAWRRWRFFRENGLDRQPLPQDEQYEEKNLRWWSKVGVVLLIFVAGLGLIVVPLLLMRRPRGDRMRV